MGPPAELLPTVCRTIFAQLRIMFAQLRIMFARLRTNIAHTGCRQPCTRVRGVGLWWVADDDMRVHVGRCYLCLRVR